MGELWGDNSLDMDDEDETSYLAACSLNCLIQHEDSMDNLDSGTGEDLWDNGTADDVNSVAQTPTTPGHDEGINSPSEENLNTYHPNVVEQQDTEGPALELFQMVVSDSENITEATDFLQKVDHPLRQKICEEIVTDNFNIMTWSTYEGKIDILKMLRDLSVDFCKLDASGRAPIHYAVGLGNWTVIELLIQSDSRESSEEMEQEHGASVTVLTKPELKTALHVAVEEGESVEVIELLVESGADVNAKDNNGNTPLHLAAKVGSVYLPEKLLENGASVNLQNNLGETALYLACQDGHAETAAVLSLHNADVKLAQHEGWSPLHIASLNAHTVIIYQLLDLNADPFCLNLDGKKPIHFACLNNLQSAVRRMLFRRGSSGEVQEVAPAMLFLLAQRSSAHEFKVIKDCLGDINGQNLFGQTALHYAAREGDLNAAYALLSNSAAPSICDRNGNTALHLALTHRHSETAKALILECSDVNEANKKKETYLYLAILGGNLDIVELLLKYGADVNGCNPRGEGLLSLAVRNNNLMLLDKLLRYGASLTQEMMHGLQPLHASAKMGHTEICRALLFEGVLVDMKESVVGRTPLHLAAEAGHLSTVVELLSHRADVNAMDIFHKKPLHLAAGEGHKDVVEVLLDTGTRVLLCDDSGSVEYDLARHQEIWDIIREWVYNTDPSAVPPPAPAPAVEAPPSYSALSFFDDS